MRICLVYQVVCYHKNEDSEEYARTSYEALPTQTLLTQMYWGSNTFYGLEACGTHEEVACLKTSEFFQ